MCLWYGVYVLFAYRFNWCVVCVLVCDFRVCFLLVVCMFCLWCVVLLVALSLVCRACVMCR